MYEEQFTKWAKWKDRRDLLPDMNLPGVYILAISDKDLSNSEFDWIEEIVYVGMTNSLSGLEGRLRQFDNTIQEKTVHGGADRMSFKYGDYGALVGRLYVAVRSFDAIKPVNPDTLRIKGDVAQFEYYCMAEYMKHHNELPIFNDPKSPKASKTVGSNRVENPA